LARDACCNARLTQGITLRQQSGRLCRSTRDQYVDTKPHVGRHHLTHGISSFELLARPEAQVEVALGPRRYSPSFTREPYHAHAIAEDAPQTTRDPDAGLRRFVWLDPGNRNREKFTFHGRPSVVHLKQETIFYQSPRGMRPSLLLQEVGLGNGEGQLT
jgi:hypothetical protein